MYRLPVTPFEAQNPLIERLPGWATGFACSMFLMTGGRIGDRLFKDVLSRVAARRLRRTAEAPEDADEFFAFHFEAIAEDRAWLNYLQRETLTYGSGASRTSRAAAADHPHDDGNGPRRPDVREEMGGALAPPRKADRERRALMQYTQLGNSGLTVSRLALGAMTFGEYSFATFHANVDQAAADRMVGLALDAGVNVFDTAEGYGQGRSEEVLGAALRRANARDRAVIATKVSTFAVDTGDPDLRRLSYRHVVGNAEAALRRLGTDWIDLYQLHAADFVTPWEETLRALDDLVSRGLVRYVGWSNHPAWHAARGQGIQELRGYAPFTSAQIYYSVVGREAEHEVLPYCRAAGLGTLTWSPLAGGFLTGKYTREDPAGAGGRRAAFSVPPVDLERGYDAIDRMREIADGRGVPVAHIAFAWLFAKPEVSSVIVGASRPEQLADNLAAADLELTDGEIAVLDAVDPPAPLYPHPRWLTGGE